MLHAEMLFAQLAEAGLSLSFTGLLLFVLTCWGEESVRREVRTMGTKEKSSAIFSYKGTNLTGPGFHLLTSSYYLHTSRKPRLQRRSRCEFCPISRFLKRNTTIQITAEAMNLKYSLMLKI